MSRSKAAAVSFASKGMFDVLGVDVGVGEDYDEEEEESEE